MLKRLYVILPILSLILISCSGADSPAAPSKKQDTVNYRVDYIKSEHVTLGVPVDKDSSDDYYIVRSQYVVDYNKNTNLPNWVAWKLVASDFGDAPRYSGNFFTDTTLPAGFYRVKHVDYTNTGYNRGHMVMSEERTSSVENNRATFILTNVVPQTADLNQGPWYKFETFCNDLAQKQNKDLYIIAGNIYTKNSANYLGTTYVKIPDSCYKIVVVLEKNQSLKDVDSNTVIYSIVMPNISGIRSAAWQSYVSNVRNIENSTGYDFLNNVAQTIQDKIEIKTNTASKKKK